MAPSALAERIDALILGRQHVAVEIEASDDVRHACVCLLQQARREILLMSRHLDGVLFNNSHASQALRDFVLRNRMSRIRILVKDPAPAVRDHHRFLELAQRLSSFVEIRVPSAEHRDYNSAFLIADGIGVLHRSLADRFEATVCFADHAMAGELTRQFNAMWEGAELDPALRRLHL